MLLWQLAQNLNLAIVLNKFCSKCTFLLGLRNYKTNFTGKDIKIVFDELIKVKDITKQVIMVGL